MAAWTYGALIGTNPHPDAVLAGESLGRLLDANESGDSFELWDTLLGRVIRSILADARPTNPDPADAEVAGALFDLTLEAQRAFVTAPPPSTQGSPDP